MSTINLRSPYQPYLKDPYLYFALKPYKLPDPNEPMFKIYGNDESEGIIGYLKNMLGHLFYQQCDYDSYLYYSFFDYDLASYYPRLFTRPLPYPVPKKVLTSMAMTGCFGKGLPTKEPNLPIEYKYPTDKPNPNNKRKYYYVKHN